MTRVFNWCLFLVAGVFCLSLAHAAGPAANPAPPKPAASPDAPVIQVPEATYDFGEALEGIEVTHDYKIKNVGKSELQITQVRPG